MMQNEVVEHYHEFGYAGPFRGIDRDKAAEIAGWIEKELKKLPRSRIGRRLRYKFRGTNYQHERLLKTRNRHLDYKALENLLDENRIMDPIFDILGPAVSLWRTQIFNMDGKEGLGWHSDEYRTTLDPIDEQISAQIAFTPTSEENCVWVLPRSHIMTDAEILKTFNLSYIEGSRESPAYGTSRYEVKDETPNPVKIVMNAGEFFIFHPRCLHRSSIDNSMGPGGRRLAMALRFASPRTKLSDAAYAQTRPREDYPVILHARNVAA